MNIDILISSYAGCPIIDCCVILFTNHLFIAHHSNAVIQLCGHVGVSGLVAAVCYSNLFVHCHQPYRIDRTPYVSPHLSISNSETLKS